MSRNTYRRRLALATGATLGRVWSCPRAAPTPTTPTTAAAVAAATRQRHVEQRRPGREVVIGFSGPAATTAGRSPAINSSAIAEAKKYSDVEANTVEGTNDANQQISQVETFINDKVDAIVLLPTDGAALTDVATKAMEAGSRSSTSTASSPRRSRHGHRPW